MNNLSNERLKEIRDCDTSISFAESAVMARELLALREAGKEPVAWEWQNRQQRHVTNDEERARNLAWDGVKVIPLYAAPQLPAVPEGAEERLGAAVELLKQAAPHMLADESLKDPDGALCGKARSVPDGWVMVPRKITLEMECALSRADSYEIGWQYAIAAAPKPEE